MNNCSQGTKTERLFTTDFSGIRLRGRGRPKRLTEGLKGRRNGPRIFRGRPVPCLIKESRGLNFTGGRNGFDSDQPLNYLERRPFEKGLGLKRVSRAWPIEGAVQQPPDLTELEGEV